MAQIAQRAAKKAAVGGGDGMAQTHDFPVLFTIDGSTKRHEVILVNPGLDLDQLKQAAEALLESPNCAEVLSKYRNREKTESVTEVRVKWSSEGRDKLFPQQTLLTESNTEAVLRMMSVNVGKDTFDVKLASKSSGGENAKPGSEK